MPQLQRTPAMPACAVLSGKRRLHRTHRTGLRHGAGHNATPETRANRQATRLSSYGLALPYEPLSGLLPLQAVALTPSHARKIALLSRGHGSRRTGQGTNSASRLASTCFSCTAAAAGSRACLGMSTPSRSRTGGCPAAAHASDGLLLSRPCERAPSVCAAPLLPPAVLSTTRSASTLSATSPTATDPLPTDAASTSSSTNAASTPRLISSLCTSQGARA